jgi:hypothetical protein
MDLRFIGTGDGSIYFRDGNVSRMTLPRALKILQAVVVLCHRILRKVDIEENYIIFGCYTGRKCFIHTLKRNVNIFHC